jgi:hypothetical protein
MSDRFEHIRLGELDPATIIWRYLTFPKFVSLLATGALWFSKLAHLEDKLEGTIPGPTLAALKTQHQEMEKWFADEAAKQQLRQAAQDNEDYGRELIVANCWFAAEHESMEMWTNYAGGGNEGVVIRSTARDLANALYMSHRDWWIGKVRYVDLSQHVEMSPYEGSQAHLRAFLKNAHFSGESEVRVATMNLVAPGCLNPDGSEPNEQQRVGLVYSEGRAGILVRVNLPALITEIRSAPRASNWHHDLIALLAKQFGLPCPVLRSGA